MSALPKKKERGGGPLRLIQSPGSRVVSIAVCDVGFAKKEGTRRGPLRLIQSPGSRRGPLLVPDLVKNLNHKRQGCFMKKNKY